MKRKKSVYLFSPGGRKAMGGMAKIIDYMLRSWPEGSDFQLHLVDTYGLGGRMRMPFYFAASLGILLAAVVRRKADIVHINMSERLSVWRKLLIALIARAFGVPVVLHLHGADFSDYYLSLGSFGKSFVSWAMARCSKILVLGSTWRDFVTQQVGLDPEQVVILHNAVPDPSPPPHEPGESCRLLFLGVVGKRKGIDILLDALAQPMMKDVDWHLTVAGSGRVIRYRNRAEDLGLGGRVVFTGQLDENQVYDQLARADVLVLPSRNEGLPLAVLEAMAFGCAIVTTPVGSIQDAVVNGQTGIVVPVRDPMGLAVALKDLTTHPESCRRLGKAARQRYETCFTLSAHVAALEKVYAGCLDARGLHLHPEPIYEDVPVALDRTPAGNILLDKTAPQSPGNYRRS